MAIAFFDLDKTLLAANSGSLWIRRELELGHITRWQALLGSMWILRYHMGFAAMETAIERAIRMLEGTEAKAIRERTNHFYEGHVRALFRPGGLKALEEHRAKGDKLVLLTSSSNYMAELVGAQLCLDGLLCNRFEIDDRGLHTGRPLGAVCFGPGKLTHATEYANSVNIPLADAWFYTDSYSDLSVMQAVGHPVAVNPDQRLRREANRRRWPVVDWGLPEVSVVAPSAHI